MVATTDKTVQNNSSSLMVIEYHPVEYYSVDDFLKTFKPLEKPRYIRSTVKASDIQDKKNELKSTSLDGKTTVYQVNEALTAIDEDGVKSIVNGVHRFYAVSELATDNDGKLKGKIKPIPVKFVKSEINDYVITSLQSKANDTTIKHSAIDKMRAIKTMWDELRADVAGGKIDLDETKIRKFLIDNYSVTKGYLVQIDNVLNQPAWLINMIDLELISTDTVQEITSAWKKFEKNPEKLTEAGVTLKDFVSDCALLAGATNFTIQDDRIVVDVNDKKSRFKIYASHVSRVEESYKTRIANAGKVNVTEGANDAGGAAETAGFKAKIAELKENGQLDEETAQQFQKLVKQYDVDDTEAETILAQLETNITADKVNIEKADIEKALEPFKPEQISGIQLHQTIANYKTVKEKITPEMEELIISKTNVAPAAHDVLSTSLKVINLVLASYYNKPSLSKGERFIEITKLADSVLTLEAELIASENQVDASLKMSQNMAKINRLVNELSQQINTVIDVVNKPEEEVKPTETSSTEIESNTATNSTETINTDITAENPNMIGTVE